MVDVSEIEKKGMQMIADFKAIADILDSDNAILNANLHDGKDTGFWRRSSVRAFFADVEAIMFYFRNKIIYDHETGENKLSLENYVMAMGLGFRVNDKGEAESYDAKVKTGSNFLFTIKLAWAGLGNPCPIDTSGKDWSNFKASMLIRDRITHPKCPRDLEILDNEQEMIISVGNWFASLMKQYAIESDKKIATLRPT